MKRHFVLGAPAVAVAALVYSYVSIAMPQGAASADEAALRQIQAQFASAWSKSDARAITELFDSDADLVIPTGLAMRGRTEIQTFYSQVFAQGYSGSQASSEISRIRFLRPDVALVDATWSITGVRNKDGSSAPSESGTLALVATKTPRGWRVAALRESASATAFHSFADLATH